MSKCYQIGSLFVLVCCFTTYSFGQQQRDSSKVLVEWVTLAPGLNWCETAAPYESKVGDSRLTIVKIDPNENLVIKNKKWFIWVILGSTFLFLREGFLCQ